MDIITKAVQNLGRTAVISANRSYKYDKILQSSESISRQMLNITSKFPGADPPRVGIYSVSNTLNLAIGLLMNN
jgi:5,10-methenyltetrahydromethanopterin hydrogenase